MALGERVSDQSIIYRLSQIEDGLVQFRIRGHSSSPSYRLSLQQRSVKRRREHRQGEVGYKRNANHFWTWGMYVAYTVMMGNGVDGLPPTVLLTFELSGFVFLFLRFMTIIIFMLPMLEVEVFMGRYSKLSNSQVYRMTPLAFGLSVINLIFNFLYVPMLMTEVPLLLIGGLRVLILSDYMRECPEGDGFCYDYRVGGPLRADNCTHSYLSLNCTRNGRIAYVAQYYFWRDFYDHEEVIDGGAYEMWPVVLVCCISWVALLSIVLFRMKCIKWFFFVSAVFYLVVLASIMLMAVNTDGAAAGFRELVTLRKWPTLKTVGLVVTLTTINIKLISPVGHMTHAAFICDDDRNDAGRAKARRPQSNLCFVLQVAHLLYGVIHVLLVAAIAGVLANLYGVRRVQDMIVPRIGMYYAMIFEFLNFKKASLFFTLPYFVLLWLLELSKLAVVIHFQILNFIDFIPSLCRFENYVRVGWCCLACIINLVIYNKFSFWFLPTYYLANAYFLEAIRLFIVSFIYFYVYGCHRIEDDILFQSGKSVIKFWQIVWPIYPLLSLAVFIAMTFSSLYSERDADLGQDVPYNHPMLVFCVGMGVSGAYLLGALLFEYLFILNGIGSHTSLSALVRPDFHWGPWEPRVRRERKQFAPRIKIRSLQQCTTMQRIRQDSIRQMHEQDIAEGIPRGRVFLDSHFFTNCEEAVAVKAARSRRIRYH